MHLLQLGGKAYKTTHRAARRKRAMRVPLPVPPSREALQPPVRVTSARSITMPVRKSIGASGSTDQEIWSVVVFVKKPESVSAEDFKARSSEPPGGH